MKNDEHPIRENFDVSSRPLLYFYCISLESIWSVYERTLGSEPRTTHFLEGWHRCISSILGQAHPNIWNLLEFLKGEQSNTELRKQALLRGESLSKKSSKAVSRKKRLQKIVPKFQMRTNNGHTCMDYPGGVGTQCNTLTGSNTKWNCIVTDRKSSITVLKLYLVANQLFATSEFLKYVYDIEKVLLS